MLDSHTSQTHDPELSANTRYDQQPQPPVESSSGYPEGDTEPVRAPSLTDPDGLRSGPRADCNTSGAAGILRIDDSRHRRYPPRALILLAVIAVTAAAIVAIGISGSKHADRAVERTITPNGPTRRHLPHREPSRPKRRRRSITRSQRSRRTASPAPSFIPATGTTPTSECSERCTVSQTTSNTQDMSVPQESRLSSAKENGDEFGIEEE